MWWTNIQRSMVSLQKVYQTWICIMIYHDISQIIISWKQYSTATHMASEKASCVSLCVASTSHVRHGQMVKWPWHDCPCLRDGGMIRSPKKPMVGGSMVYYSLCHHCKWIVNDEHCYHTGLGKYPNWTSTNYWAYHLQQILESDVPNPPFGGHWPSPVWPWYIPQPLDNAMGHGDSYPPVIKRGNWKSPHL